ncbi:MAG: asparagine synthase (glutamine-hydrolyzing) [Acidobacteria bacterium]|nr:asparagine synthase (glutamine-hydrolyzing) [Acidobacteriota bacterium]MCA1651264.1 asparagine synthase (glutamine-hydrolyzing) [Acidobacteriota bacterium]
MCGIVGVVSPELSRERVASVLRAMNDAIAHRGPDDSGAWREDGVGFAMRRLSIIDLAGGHQPMWDEQTGVGVVFNGEIYNYAALRERIVSSEALTTHSDTEVVLKTFARQGLPAVQQWNGMFAVAAWDPRQRQLTLIRDRIGVKPLYYFWDGTSLLFASEIKALLASGMVPRHLDRQALWDYLTFRYVPGPASIWQNIRKLPPGHALELAPGGNPREICYWSSDVVADEQGSSSLDSAQDEFTALFLDAVQLRLVASDVPVGVLLSGGLDSSAVAAAAVELGHRNFHTFSVGFDEPDYSELSYARAMAAHVGANQHEVVIDQRQFLDALPEVVVSTDEPIADLATVPLLAVCRLARKDVKVVLSGEGSDEILAGYTMDREVRRIERIRRWQQLPRPMIVWGEKIGSAVLGEPFARRAARIAHEPLGDWNRRDRPHISIVFREDEKQQLMPTAGVHDSAYVLDREYGAARSDDPLQQMLAVYQKSWLVEDLLMKADKMSMATSLELRTPFLDYRLVEWANRQPNHVKVARTGRNQYTTKYVLRRFCRERLPASITERPKRGFPVPAYRWLQRGLGPWARDTLTGPASRLGHWLAPEPVHALCSLAEQGNANAAHKVWLLIMLALWAREWNAQLAE